MYQPLGWYPKFCTGGDFPFLKILNAVWDVGVLHIRVSETLVRVQLDRDKVLNRHRFQRIQFNVYLSGDKDQRKEFTFVCVQCK